MIALIILFVLIILFISFPAKCIHFLVTTFGKLLYKASIKGQENIPKKGGALLIANHVSFIDFILIAMSVPRMVRFVMYKDIYEKKHLKWLLKKLNMIPISPRGGTNNLREFNRLCQKEINAGHTVVIFAEGTVTRNGHLLEFKRGFEHISRGINAPIIPIHMEGVIGSPLSFSINNHKPNGFKAKLLRKRVFVNIGKPMSNESTAFDVRQRIQEINAETLFDRIENYNQLAEHVLKLNGDRILFKNENNEELKASDFRKKAIQLALELRKKVKNHAHVGILLEHNFNMYISLCAINLLGKTPVLLNWEFTKEQIEKIESLYNYPPCLVNINNSIPDIKNTLDIEKLIGQSQKRNSFLLETIPNELALSYLGNKTNKLNYAVSIPHFDGKELIQEDISHQSLIGQTYSLQQVHDTSNYGYILNINNHKTGIAFITNFILPIVAKTKSVIYNPVKTNIPPISLANTIIGPTELIERQFTESDIKEWKNIKFIISTEQKFDQTVETKLTQELKIKIYRGMGKIGIAPIISLNTPDFEGKDIAGKALTQQANDSNSVGRPLPGIAAKIVNKDNIHEELKANEIGLIFLKGMLLSKSSNTTSDWINSELIGSIDEKGFLKIAE